VKFIVRLQGNEAERSASTLHMSGREMQGLSGAVGESSLLSVRMYPPGCRSGICTSESVVDRRQLIGRKLAHATAE
jgi:hypothetical protein